jgi:hypothetical protein
MVACSLAEVLGSTHAVGCSIGSSTGFIGVLRETPI